MKESWLAYEKAAQKAIEAIGSLFGITSIEGKQQLAGQSGISWEVDARAWSEDSRKFLVIEARRYTNSKLKKKDIAALIFQIQDLGAQGGIVISPLPLQEGARVLAANKGIEHVLLSAESTPELYLAEYLNRRFHGVSTHDGLTVSAMLISGELRDLNEADAALCSKINSESSHG